MFNYTYIYCYAGSLMSVKTYFYPLSTQSPAPSARDLPLSQSYSRLGSSIHIFESRGPSGRRL